MKSPAILFALFLLMENVHAQQGKTPAAVMDSTTEKDTDEADSTDFDKVFVKVEKEAIFPGGVAGWSDFVRKNLDGDAPNKDNLKSGTYPIDLRFDIDANGKVIFVSATEMIRQCPHCVLAAQKLIKKSPKWSPAMQQGKKVRYQVSQRITFAVP